MRDLGDYEASGRKTNRDQMRLATLSSNPVLHFMCGPYSCVGDVAKGARVSAGSRLGRLVRSGRMFSKYNPPIRTFPHIPAATRLRGAEQEPNCEIENPESRSKVRDIRYDLLFLVIFFAEISAQPPRIHWCPIHSLSSLKTPLG